LAARLNLVEQFHRVRVLVRRHLERKALVHRVESGETVKFWAHNLEHRDIAGCGKLQDLFDAVIVFDACSHVESVCGNFGAQCFEHRVAAGNHLRLVSRLRNA
jgi:hypothetical protein